MHAFTICLYTCTVHVDVMSNNMYACVIMHIMYMFVCVCVCVCIHVCVCE